MTVLSMSCKYIRISFSLLCKNILYANTVFEIYIAFCFQFVACLVILFLGYIYFWIILVMCIILAINIFLYAQCNIYST